jgi:hypothetical protein
MFGEWTQLWNINHVGNEAKDETSKPSRLLMGSEQVTRPKILRPI